MRGRFFTRLSVAAFLVPLAGVSYAQTYATFSHFQSVATENFESFTPTAPADSSHSGSIRSSSGSTSGFFGGIGSIPASSSDVPIRIVEAFDPTLGNTGTSFLTRVSPTSVYAKPFDNYALGVNTAHSLDGVSDPFTNVDALTFKFSTSSTLRTFAAYWNQLQAPPSEYDGIKVSFYNSGSLVGSTTFGNYYGTSDGFGMPADGHDLKYVAIVSESAFDEVRISGYDVVLDNASVGTIAAVPEPTSMVALGFGAIALLRRRKRS